MKKLFQEPIRLLKTKIKFGFSILSVFLSLGFGQLYAQNILIDEQLAAEYFLSEKYEEAAELYTRLYEKTSNPSYYQSLLKIYIELKEFKKAEKLIEKRKKQYPADLTLMVDLGRVHLENNSRSKAHKNFRSAISFMPLNASVIESLANAFIGIREPAFAIETYEAAQKLFRNKQFFVFELLALYEKTGQYEKMVTECLDLLEDSPIEIPQIQLFLQPYFSNPNSASTIQFLKKSLIKRSQASPNKRQLTSMLLWFSLQEKDFDLALSHAIAIDKRYPNENGNTVFQIGEISLSNQNYKIAGDAFKYLISKGAENPYYMESQVGFLNSKYLEVTQLTIFDQKKMNELVESYIEGLNLLGKNRQTLPLMKNFAHLQAFYLNDIQAASDILYDAMEIAKGNKKYLAEVKLDLADILFFGGDVWEASLLYMQAEKDFKNDILGAEAKYRNAKLSYYIGEFQWAKTQLEVLRASTSKLIANDAMKLSLLISDNMDDDSTYGALTYYAKADLLSYRNLDNQALDLLDSISVFYLTHSLFDEVLFKKATIKLKQSMHHEADSLLQHLITFYPYDILADDALFILGELYEKEFQLPGKALLFYEQIILEHPASIFVTEARKRYHTLQEKR